MVTEADIEDALINAEAELIKAENMADQIRLILQKPHLRWAIEDARRNIDRAQAIINEQ